MRGRARVAGLLALGAIGTPGAAEAQRPFAELAYVNDGRIYSLRADGTARTPLVIPGGRRETTEQPVWSPDGRTLAYVRSLESGGERGDDERSQIMLRSAVGTTALTPLRKGVSDLAPAWSPDGRRIAFTRYVERKDDFVNTIRIVGRDGGAETELARTSLGGRLTSISSPSWRPDGRAIAYLRSEIGPKAYFKAVTLVAELGGGKARVLVDKAGPVSWSPDGRWLTYSSIRDRNGEECGSDECSYNSEIYVSRADGTGARRLTRNRGDDSTPTWSPDGSRILFASSRNFPDGDAGEIYTIAPDGSCLTWLTNGTPGSFSPAWRPGLPGEPAPPRCGDTGRPPLVEVAVGRHPRDTLWLGQSHRGLLLSHFQGSRTKAFLAYDDCRYFDPRRCPPTGLQVASDSVCRREAFVGAFETGFPLRRRRGALVASYGSEGGLDIYSGRANTSVHTQLGLSERRARREYARAFRSLVRVGRGDSPGGRLPAPRVSGKVARQLRSAVRATRGSDVRTAAKSLRITRAKLRNRLRFARALRKTGGLRAVRCPR